jgi:hypothetical protein
MSTKEIRERNRRLWAYRKARWDAWKKEQKEKAKAKQK